MYMENSAEEISDYNVSDDSVPGQMIINVTDELVDEIENAHKDGGEINPVAVKSFAETVSSIRIRSIRRLFPHAGKFEERTRAEGLHRWYVVEYDETVATRTAASAFDLPGVTEIEVPGRIVLTGSNEAIYCDEPPVRSSSYLFDDPRLPDQWHYLNDGSAASSVSGCDINIVPVWRNYTTGSPDVIVSVVDGGIDFTHEDLAGNMWENPSQTGDRRFGYNFAKNGYRVTADNHGTHVAGTISAVNNNGIGVCGIAGGDAAAGKPGAKLMSCQIFDGEEQGSGAEAIKWGADHGAVISQNSWGYKEATGTPSSLKAAVDYFIKYAGMDENGNQVGPMAGGLVLFAAGNENSSIGYPAEYAPIVAVSSVGADYRRAYYSNYGLWTDIAAPGGDAKKGNQVISTLPGNKYGRMQGTSMACPHVSGVAALLISHFGGPGFTADALKQRLLDNVTDIQGFNRNHHLGNGLLNAYMAIAGSGGTPPDKPTDFELSAMSNNVTFSITVPKDDDDNVPYSIIIYYGTSENPEDNDMFALFHVGDKVQGERMTGTIGGLEFEQTYYFYAVASDLAANRSDRTELKSLITGSNTSPVINSLTGNNIILKPHQTAEAMFECYDPDGHYINIELEPGSDAAVLDTTILNSPKIRITGSDAESGTYKAQLTVTDIYGASVCTGTVYEILENHKPYIIKEFDNLVFTQKNNRTQEFDATDYFADDDGEQLSYSIVLSEPSVLNFTYARGRFNLTTMNFGTCDVTVTATDIRKSSVSQTFRVVVQERSNSVNIYPNPTKDYIFIGTDAESDVIYKIYSPSGHTVASGNEKIIPYSPLKIDVSEFAGGIYKMEIMCGGKKSSKTFVKL